MNKGSAEVNRFMEQLNHPLKEEINKIRTTILCIDQDITEHIKWNAPSFCYRGEDRITFHLRRTDRITLIFHRGPKAKHTKFVFKDPTGLLTWAAADRGMITFMNNKDVEGNLPALSGLVKKWMQATVE